MHGRPVYKSVKLRGSDGCSAVRVRRRPRYENGWGRHPDCRRVVEGVWAALQGRSVGERLIECGRQVWRWGSGVNRAEGVELRHCESRLESLRGRRDERGLREFGRAQRRYMLLLQNTSDKWKQRAKELWFRGGDQNSRFFHNSVNRRRRRNMIVGLREPGGALVREEAQKGGIMVRYFTNLFSPNEGEAGPALENLERRVTADQNAYLSAVGLCRYFPSSKAKKYCYSLPVAKGKKLLVKTVYYYCGFDGGKEPPVFDQIIDGTK
nr:uncharacterized protein LOC109152193 [Ipomoea batatas]